MCSRPPEGEAWATGPHPRRRNAEPQGEIWLVGVLLGGWGVGEEGLESMWVRRWSPGGAAASEGQGDTRNAEEPFGGRVMERSRETRAEAQGPPETGSYQRIRTGQTPLPRPDGCSRLDLAALTQEPKSGC